MSARSVGRHTVWNIFGQVVPIGFAVVALPILVSRLGLDRYGFLTLVWVLVGYLGVFDFGVGRALTRVVAERLGAGDKTGADQVARVSLTFLACIGVVLAVLLLAGAPLVMRLLALPDALQHEGLNAVRILGFCMPFVMLTSGYRGYLEAHRAFGVLNMIRIGMGMLTYLAPLVATLISPRLESMVASVLLMRVIANYVHRRACLASGGADLRFERPSVERMKPVLKLGGWITVSNVVSPLMNSLDRLLIGALVPIAAIGMYATAYDVTTKVLIVAYSLTGAAFPMFAAMTDPERARSLYSTFCKTMLVVVWPILFVMSLCADSLFRVWMGPEFARVSGPAMQILAVGLFFNCLAQVPAMMIQSRGSPKWMAVLHVIEMPIFLGVIYLLTKRFGVLGTAAAWSTRVGIDALALHYLVARRLAPGAIPAPLAIALFVIGPLALLLPFVDATMLQRLLLGLGLTAAFLAMAWAWLFNQEERGRVSATVLSQFGRLAK